MHLALGGCLSAPPVRFGLTADTGGHIAYLLEAATAQASLPQVRRVSLVTRLFENPELGCVFANPSERLNAKTTIDRIATNNRNYLEKEALSRDLPAFTEAFCRHLRSLHGLPDVIHAHFADAATVAEAARMNFGIPFVYTPHALGLNKRRQMLAEDALPDSALNKRVAAEREAMVAADAIIVSTKNEIDQQVAAYAVTNVGARIRCLAPGIPSRGDPTGRELTLALDLDDLRKPIVLAIARPVRKKNLAAVVHAYAMTPALQDRANLVILAGQHDAGFLSEEEREVVAELQALCEASPLKGRVALPPAHNADDVALLYQKAAVGGVFVNPALHEPFGLTLIEAAAAGVPVVATRQGGPVDIIATTGHGVLVDPQDTAAIGAACLRIVSDQRLHARLSSSALANIDRYSWPHYAAASVALYASLRSRPRLLVSDIDNTLTGCIAGARSFNGWSATRSIPFVVATGRSFEEARTIIPEWELPLPDAFIVDVGTRIMLPQGARGWGECTDYARLLDADWDRCAVVGRLLRLGLCPQPRETEGPHKISFFGSEAGAHSIRRTLDEAGLSARVVFSHGQFIDVLAPRAGKAAALAYYAETLGLSLDDCIAVGDSGNDFDMLEACGRAIVVGNASAELDALSPRGHLIRVAGHHATGVMEGLGAFGLAEAKRREAPTMAAA